MNITKKRMLLLLGVLLVLAWLLPSEATFHVCYADPDRVPALVYIDDKAAFEVRNNPFRFSPYKTPLRPGAHTLALRNGRTTVKTWFLYFHLNSTVVEYTLPNHYSDHTWDARLQLGRFSPD